MNKRTKEQNKRIWSLVARFAEKTGMTYEEAETVMRNRNEVVNGTRRTSILDQKQADKLIRDFESFSRKAKPILTLNNMITEKQMKTIEHLFEDAGFYSLKARQSFSMRTIKKPWPQTRSEAVKIHEGLEAIIIRKNPRESLEKKIAICFYNWLYLTKWERDFLTDIDKKFQENISLNAYQIKKLLEIERKVLKKESAVR